MKNYYNEKTINKFREALKNAIQEINNGTVTHVTFSKGNSKMGNVHSVSLLPFLTCPSFCKRTCGKECYAAKIANLYPSVLKSYARNTALAIFKPELFWKEINEYLKGIRFFRFHVSGDILGKKYFKNMVTVAKNNPYCEILVFTKQFKIVNAFLNEGNPIPENLHILFSGWNNLKPENPHNLPETTVFNKSISEIETEKQVNTCTGNCFTCACNSGNCWNASHNSIIAFKKH